MRGLVRALVPAAALAAAAAYAAQSRELTLAIGDLEARAFSAKDIRARLTGPRLQSLELHIGRLSVGGRTWQKTTLVCPEAQLSAQRIACASGTLDAGGKMPVSFSYGTARRELAVEAKPAAGETWRLAGRFGPSPAAIELRIEGGRLERLGPWLPPGLPKISAGRANATLAMNGENVKARADIEGLAFADASGLHAGEKIAATFEGEAEGKGDAWRWNARLGWRGGDVFWEPVFVAGKGQRLELQGATAGGRTEIRSLRLELPNVATLTGAATWDHAKAALTRFEVTSKRVALPALYADLLKPLLQGTALADLRSEGSASFTVRGDAAGLAALDLVFENASFDDRQRRFGLFGLNGRLPWRRDEATQGEVALEGGEVLKIPIGATRVPMRLKGSSVDIDNARIPIFDGAVTVKDFAIGMARSGWRWRFSAEVAPISMEQLTSAMGLPQMHGAIAGVIPELTYRRQTLDMDGELAFRLFDGVFRASRVQMIDPFGAAPRLHADIEVKDVDLDLLTRTFDFGSITGRVDATIGGLELVAWQPVRFDARIASSAGRYPRKISQRAVQNISALGGAGAAAAIQRSLLRFFEEFGYDRLGISCRLQNGVCYMDGIESAPQGYVIVKGGGIPAISVIGYNRAVNWLELVERLKRVTQGNVKPLVQ